MLYGVNKYNEISYSECCGSLCGLEFLVLEKGFTGVFLNSVHAGAF